MATAREILLGTTRVHREHLHARRASVTGALALILTGVCIAIGSEPSALPLVIGSTFTGILTLTGAPDTRLRAMTWTVLWLTGATLLGGLVSTWRWYDLAVVAVVGLVGGYAGALGSRGMLIGVLSMVSYTVFAGVDVSPGDAVQTAALVAAGGLLHLLVTAIWLLLRERSSLLQRTEHPEPWRARLDPRRRTDDLFLHHAIRLCVALVIGTAIADTLAWPHPYWIPMTIVWMSKPDAQGTVTRVVERILGTAVGVVVAAVLIDGISDGDIAIPLYTGIGVFLLLAFLFANYPIAVVGVTLMVITLLSLPGRTVVDTLDYRLVATLVAGAVTLAVALSLWRSPAASSSE